MSYFVKIPDKFRRPSKRSKYGREPQLRVAPIWTFSEEKDAVEFAKSFFACLVQVWHEGKVIFQNYSSELPQWYKDHKAGIVHETVTLDKVSNE